MSEQAGNALAGYRFHKVLGEGPRAGTFEATESASGDAVVIESLVGDDARDADRSEWFRWAWQALAAVEHPSLPAVREVGEGGEGPFAVREPVAGTRLDELIERGERIDPATMRVLAYRIADGLDVAHEAGVVHGALSAGSLVVEPEGATARWVGFGRVEGLRGDDVRTLGAVLDQLLAAEHETRGDTEVDRDEGPSMDEAIVAMLSRVAATAREGGYPTAGHFRDEVAAGTERPRGWRRVRGLFRRSPRQG